MDFTVRHAIPGRIRLQVPVLCAPSPLAESALAWLRKREFIVTVRINYDCANLIIEYRAEQSNQLDELLDMLAGFSIDDLDQLLRFLDPTGAAGAVGAARSAHVPEKQRWPLALPTLSLVLAFSRNPCRWQSTCR